jgi:hypothetical protein
MGLVNNEDFRRAINSQCSCGGREPSLGCVWCEMYHAAMALMAIRSGLNMDPEGATPYEVAEEVKNVYRGRTHALATLCGQVNGLRDLIAEVDRLLRSEFGGFYESASSTDLIGRARDMLRSQRADIGEWEPKEPLTDVTGCDV